MFHKSVKPSLTISIFKKRSFHRKIYISAVLSLELQYFFKNNDNNTDYKGHIQETTKKTITETISQNISKINQYSFSSNGNNFDIEASNSLKGGIWYRC